MFPCVCLPSLPAASRTGQVQEHVPEGLLLAGRLPLTHPGTRTGTVPFSCLGSPAQAASSPLRTAGDWDGAKGAAGVGAVCTAVVPTAVTHLQVPSRPNALGLCPHPLCGKSPSRPPVKLLVGSDANYTH